MIEDFRVLSARREYVFGADQLRLSMVNTPGVQNLLRQTFSFKATQQGAGLPLFHPSIPSNPPGIVFAGGAWANPDGHVVFIRGLSFDVLRMVIDIVGHSHDIDVIATTILDMVNSQRTFDGNNILGDIKSTRDYSEVSAVFPYPVSKMLHPNVRETVEKWLPSHGPLKKWLPQIHWQAIDPSEPYPGETQIEGHVSAIGTRMGSAENEHLFFSSAALDTQQHYDYLVELSNVLSD